MTYKDFLKNKQIQTENTGFKPMFMAKGAFEWQKAIAAWSCRVGRAALFEDCGLGKTLQQLIWAENVHRHTNKPILILSPLAVSQQTRREGEKFGINVKVVSEQKEITNGINITNYEKLEHFDADAFSGVVLDESSILKSYMGKTKRRIIESFKNTPYKMACTATPAPNDLMELLNHAEFLGVMKSSEALAIWFLADQSQSGKYRLKGHAEQDFWRWCASWAVCLSRPSDIGYEDTGYVLPELNEANEVIRVSEISDDFSDGMLRKIDMSATGFHKEKRRTLKARCERTADIANATNEQVVVWTYQNDEADYLKKLMPDAVEVRGSHSAQYKENSALDFINGKYRVLISKPSIFGYGLNLQNCRNVIFNGLDYSYENYYQAVRRFYRYGQSLPVNVWRVIGSTELNILNVIDTKQRQKEDMERGMAHAMKEHQSASIRGERYKLDTKEQIPTVPNWLKELA